MSPTSLRLTIIFCLASSILGVNHSHRADEEKQNGTSAWPVSVSFHLKRVESIDVLKGTADLEVIMTTEWEDPGLARNVTEADLLLTDGETFHYWMPQLHIAPAARTFSFLWWTRAMRITPQGQVVLREPMRLTARCHHEAAMFPADTFSCSLIIEPIKDNLALRWEKDNGTRFHSKKAIVHRPFGIERIEFTSDIGRDAPAYANTLNEDISHLYVDIVFRRRSFGYFWFNVIMPVLFCVMVCYSTLFLNREKFMALRIGLAAGMFVAVQALSYFFNSAIRSTEQPTVLDALFQVSSFVIAVSLTDHVVISIRSARKMEESSSEGFNIASDAKTRADIVPERMDYLAKVFMPVAFVTVLFYVLYNLTF